MDSVEVARAGDGRKRVVVVGAGIAGLAAAWFLRRDAGDRPEPVEVTVLDGSGRVGGKLKVTELAGLAVDEGAEAILNRRPEGVELARAVGLTDAIRHPAQTSAGVWSYGALRALPGGTLMGVPTDVAAVRASGVLSAAAVAQLEDEPERAGEPIVDDIAIGRYADERLGADAVDRLIEPLLGGVYAGHARELSLAATVPALVSYVRDDASLIRAARRARESAPASDQPVFAGVTGGVGRLAGAVADALVEVGVTIRTDAMVRELHRRDRGWQLVVGPTRAPELIDADAVVIACPATPASRLLKDVAPHAADDLAGIEYASVGLVSAVYPKTAATRGLTGSGFLVPPVENRIIKAATYSSMKWGWLGDDAADRLVVRCSVGRHREEADLQYDDAELTARALADLAELTGLVGTPIETRVTRWGGALPQYAVGHGERVRRIRAAVDAVPGLAVCGAAYDGLGIPACIASAAGAAGQILRTLR